MKHKHSRSKNFKNVIVIKNNVVNCFDCECEIFEQLYAKNSIRRSNSWSTMLNMNLIKKN